MNRNYRSFQNGIMRFTILVLFSVSILNNIKAQTQGCIMDNGGINGNYNQGDYHNINVCGATKITLIFKQFNVAPGCLMKIFDGTNAAGKPLHPGSGFTSENPPSGPIVATSGSIYTYFSATGSDSGYQACWIAEVSSKAPVASFEIPDTLNTIKYTYKNTSQNLLGQTDYEWSIYPEYGTVGYTKDLDFAILKDGIYDATLKVTTCLGKSEYSKKVVVLTPSSKVNLDFIAKNRHPPSNQVDTLFAISSLPEKPLTANRFYWSFFPNTVTYVNGTKSDMQTIQVKFNDKGKYNVTLRAWVSSDSAASIAEITKNQYILVDESWTSIADIKAPSYVNIYPNPSKGIINITNIFPFQETIDIQIYNAIGKLVAETNGIFDNTGIQTIDLSKEGSGLYSVKIRAAGGQITRKVSITN